MNTAFDILSPDGNATETVNVDVKDFNFSDTFEAEDGVNTPFEVNGRYFDAPDSFMGVHIEECVVTILDWSNENPESIRASVEEAMRAHFNTSKVTLNCSIDLV